MNSPSEKRKKFVKLAEGRTQAALTAIRKIGNLSNTAAYEYTAADMNKIAKVLKEAIAEVERKFDPQKEVKETFKL